MNRKGGLFRVSQLCFKFLLVVFISFACDSRDDGVILDKHKVLKNSSFEQFYCWDILRRNENINTVDDYAMFRYYSNDTDFVYFSATIKQGEVNILIKDTVKMIGQLNYANYEELHWELIGLARSFFSLNVLGVCYYPNSNGCVGFTLEGTNQELYFDPNRFRFEDNENLERIVQIDKEWHYLKPSVH